MKSGAQNLLIMILFVMCCWQVKILGRNIYHEILDSRATAEFVKLWGSVKEHGLEKPYILEKNTK